MSRRDFSDLEDQIRDTVKNAFDAIDFADIKKGFNDKTEDAINEVKIKIKDKSHKLNKKMKYEINNAYKSVNDMTSNMARNNGKKVQRYIAKRPMGSISGFIYTIVGSILSGLMGILLIGSAILSIANAFPQDGYIGVGVISVFFLSSMFLTFKGRYLRKRIKRFKEYVDCLGDNEYCSIEELSVSIGKKNKFVVKDLRKMIELDMFPEAHIDDEQTYFMLNNEVYEKYLNSKEALKKRNEEELKRQEKLNEDLKDPAKKELRNTIEIGRNYIQQIKSANDDIPEEEISEKLSRLENIVSQIFKHVENNPTKLSEVNRFTNHYLPMTLKLVVSYKELNEQPVQGVNIRNARNEIEKAIDSINIAFEKLLDDLFEEVALDISTDISVLETLFTQEGLTKKDFEK